VEHVVPNLEEGLVGRVVARIRELEPATIAVLLRGSYLTGTADASSDLDLTAITSSEPEIAYRTWFVNRNGGLALHVSAQAMTASAWVERRKTPARWSLGFPAIEEAQYLWTTPEGTRVLGDPPTLMRPPAGPELEDFFESILKAKRSAERDDELGLRWFAQLAASLAPTLLIALNTETLVRDRRDALDAALSLEKVPSNYRHDLTVCLGLTAAPAAEVSGAVDRLGRELLAFLREHAPDVDPQPDIARYLADGTLERHLG
jgi:phosphoribosyl-AMP cyclohydrolase